MSQPLVISVREARRFMLSHLLLSGEKTEGPGGVMKVFERLNCVQFDPLSVAGRNHDIVLQARVKDYKPAICEKLLYKDRLLLDAWDRKMGIIRTTDWPLFRRFHAQTRKNLGGKDGEIFPVLDKIRALIRERGPVIAKEMNISGEADWWFGTGNWGSPNLGRVALEAMLLWGELVIAHKNNGRKAYDFAEKLLPKEIIKQGDPHKTEESYADWRVQRRVASAGLIQKGHSSVWMSSAILTPVSRNAAIARLLKNGSLLQVHVEGVKPPFLARAEDWVRYETDKFTSDGKPRFIAPLDNLMWDRTLISALFGMDYHWEVYEPPQKRRFGYYVIPILAGDELVGRVEPFLKKGDRAMRVKGFWRENGNTASGKTASGAKPGKIGKKAILRAIEEYAQFMGVNDYVVEDAARENL